MLASLFNPFITISKPIVMAGTILSTRKFWYDVLWKIEPEYTADPAKPDIKESDVKEPEAKETEIKIAETVVQPENILYQHVANIDGIYDRLDYYAAFVITHHSVPSGHIIRTNKSIKRQPTVVRLRQIYKDIKIDDDLNKQIKELDNIYNNIMSPPVINSGFCKYLNNQSIPKVRTLIANILRGQVDDKVIDDSYNKWLDSMDKKARKTLSNHIQKVKNEFNLLKKEINKAIH